MLVNKTRQSLEGTRGGGGGGGASFTGVVTYNLPSFAFMKPNPASVSNLATPVSLSITPAPLIGPQFIASPGRPSTCLRYCARESWKALQAEYDDCPMLPTIDAMDENITKKSRSISKLIWCSRKEPEIENCIMFFPAIIIRGETAMYKKRIHR